MTTKRCAKCRVIKSVSLFNKNKNNPSGLHSYCKTCHSILAGELTGRGLKVLKDLATTRGQCEHCSRLYTEEDWHFFEFDHIDAKLKQSKRETNVRWIAGHINEFLTRVVPNLQLLCVKCHKIKSVEEQKLGGSVYQKMYGQSEPAQVIQRDLTLFDPHLIIEPGEEYTLHAQEGEWITVRDIDGNLIRYEPLSNFIKH